MRTNSCIVIIVLFISTLIAFPSLAATILVPTDQPTIQACLDSAEAGDECIVQGGTYYENVVWPDSDGIILRGTGPRTVIDGSGAGPVIVIEGAHSPATSILDLRVTLGYARHEHGAGIRLVGSSPTIANVILAGNVSNLYMEGTGIYAIGGGPVIRKCVVQDNHGGYRGGGICLELCEGALVEGCLIRMNETASGWGFAYGAGIYVVGSSDFLLCNNIIVDNVIDFGWGGGLGVEDSSGRLVNNTFSRNVAGNGYGGGIYIGWSDGVVAVNNILWGDIGEYGDDEIYVDHGTLSVTFSDVMGGWSGEGNIDADPLFISDWNYHLRPGSPCINAGTDAGVYTDIDGQSRPWGAGFDMGADELSTEPCSTIASSGNQFLTLYLIPALALVFLRVRAKIISQNSRPDFGQIGSRPIERSLRSSQNYVVGSRLRSGPKEPRRRSEDGMRKCEIIFARALSRRLLRRQYKDRFSSSSVE